MKVFGRLMVVLAICSANLAYSCSPCGPLTNVTQTVVGTNLNLTFNSNAGWNCCYTVQIEIICNGAAFTGIPNYFSSQLCLTAGANTNQPYPLTVIDISGYCPGTYQWQAKENNGCNNPTPVYTFTVPGVPTPLVLTPSPIQDTICLGESVQLDIAVSGGCNSVLAFNWIAFPGLSSYSISNPVATPLVTTTYGVTVTETNNICTGPGIPISITIVVLPSLQVNSVMVSDTCSSGVGTINVSVATGSPPYTYNWPGLGSNSPNVNGLTPGNYDVEVSDFAGCEGNLTVLVDDYVPAYQGSSTIVSCEGGSDGTAFAEMVPPIGTVTYAWNDPGAQTTQTAVGLEAGAYICTVTSSSGCSDDVAVVVTENVQLLGNEVNHVEVSCNSGNDGLVELLATQGVGPYTYSWTNSTSTTETADNLSAGNYVCTITDNLGCTIDVPVVITEPLPLDITFITPYTEICPEEGITLDATGSGGSSAYTFTWYENGNLIGTGASIYVDHDYANTNYCVVLSELCGSPTDEECTVISFHTPIVPNANPVSICYVGLPEFINTSSNAGEVATTFWEFGDVITHNALVNGTDPITHQYDAPGVYDVTMTVTSIYGCVYSSVLDGLAEIIGDPQAIFDFSVNPTTIFETTVFTQDHSSFDVVSWAWESPFSEPSYGEGNSIELTFPIGETGTYPVTLIVVTADGCSDTVTVLLSVLEDSFYAPNTFTPDGDEFNQVWKPEVVGIDIYDYDLFIFNRWGQLIFESHDANVGWDGTYNGKIVETGTYVWKAVTSDPNNDDKTTYSGTINLLK